MIICFTGTGNSRIVADKIQDLLGDELLRLAPGLMKDPRKATINVDDSRLIWVFPVHAWSLPTTVMKTIMEATMNASPDTVHHMVATCGDDIGLTEKVWRKAIESRGWKAGSAFSVQMPNSYPFLPGFDVDSPELAKAKLDAMPDRLDTIVDNIDAITPTTQIDVVKGRYAWIKTRIFNPFFVKFLKSTRHFHTNSACNGCGQCSRNCPIMTISMENHRPKWAEECIMCTRCYHVCPMHAIEYGRWSKGKGQYLCHGFGTNL